MKQINELMKKAISEGIFPGGSLLFSLNGKVYYNSCFGVTNLETCEPVNQSTIYDLASLTKPLATTIALMYLVQQNALKPDQKISDFIPLCSGTEKQNILIRHLLCHTSGLKAYEPYYKTLYKYPKIDRKKILRSLLLKEELEHPPGTKVVYSDLGFMFLEWIIENIVQLGIDQFIKKTIYEPLGLNNLFYIDLFSKKNTIKYSFAATEKCPWRKKTLIGEVHDDNTYVVGGVGGHAGLFGDINSVHNLLLYLLKAYHNDNSNGKPGKSLAIKQEIVRLFLSRNNCINRTYGFDIPSKPNSSSGDLFSKNTAGHLGFTGTSFWIDLDRAIIVILLTNRVHPTRDNNKIREFRPKIHNIVMDYILKLNHF